MTPWLQPFVAAVVLLVAILPASTAGAQDASRPVWLTGEGFERQLEARVGIAWAAEPLRRKLDNLSRNLRVAIWLDRNIDSSQEPELTLTEIPLRVALETIAARCKAGVAVIGSVVYVGPPPVASRLATVAALRNEEAGRLPTEARARFARPVACQWEELSTPREILAAMAAEADVTLDGLDKIPHDLWAAGDWPPLTFAERLTLLLSGFEFTFEWDGTGRSVRFVPLPEKPVLVRGYTLRGEPGRVTTQLQQAVPGAELKRDGTRLTVTGRAEDHDRIQRLLRGEKVRSPVAGAATTVYSMKGPAELGAVLKTLQAQAGLTVIVDPRVEEKLRERVMFEVQSAPLQELIIAVLNSTGLRFELRDKELRILPGTP